MLPEKKLEELKRTVISIYVETRTPLSVVLGFAHLMKEKNLTPDEMEEALNRIIQSTNETLELLGAYRSYIMDEILDNQSPSE